MTEETASCEFAPEVSDGEEEEEEEWLSHVKIYVYIFKDFFLRDQLSILINSQPLKQEIKYLRINSNFTNRIINIYEIILIEK